jgi:lipoprotein-anchoring transpeptidase ErfK/SrfK
MMTPSRVMQAPHACFRKPFQLQRRSVVSLAKRLDMLRSSKDNNFLIMAVPHGCAAMETAAMLPRALLIFASASLGACNTVLSAPLDIAEIGRSMASSVHSGGDVRQAATGNSSSRSKKLARELVTYAGDELPGTIVVQSKQRRLYFILADNKAISYPVGVGRTGKQWQGRAEIEGAYVQPAWSPPPEIQRDNPKLPSVILGGSPSNPMGARALTLSGGSYAIHGTNRPGSIGGDVSYGCIRMFNEHIIDLYDRVAVGTKVVVTGG